MDRYHVTELEPFMVLVQYVSIGRRTSSRGAWMQPHDELYVVHNRGLNCHHITPLSHVILAFAEVYDLSEAEMEIMEVLAPSWESTWGDLVRAAQKL